jgi:hypothetical protein
MIVGNEKKPLNVGHSKQSNKVKAHLNHNMQSEYQAKYSCGPNKHVHTPIYSE